MVGDFNASAEETGRGPLLAGLCDPQRARELPALGQRPSGRLQGFALSLRAGTALRVAQVYGFTGAPARSGPLLDCALAWLAEGGGGPPAGEPWGRPQPAW